MHFAILHDAALIHGNRLDQFDVVIELTLVLQGTDLIYDHDFGFIWLLFCVQKLPLQYDVYWLHSSIWLVKKLVQSQKELLILKLNIARCYFAQSFSKLLRREAH